MTVTSNQQENTTRTKPARVLMAGVVGVVAATLGLGITAFSPAATPLATGSQACVNGIVPLNPYVVNCNLPARGHQVIGAAPDAGAIIGCRHNLACLALYVNYPGALLVPGYQP